MASTVRSSGIVPSTITATGVRSAERPRASAVGDAGAFSTAISITSVPRSLATASHSTSESGWPGGRWPEMTVNSCATPRCVTGMPDPGRHGDGGVSPGTTVTGTPAASQAMISS